MNFCESYLLNDKNRMKFVDVYRKKKDAGKEPKCYDVGRDIKRRRRGTYL